MSSRFSTKIKTADWYGVFLSFIYCFCTLAAYYVMRPMRDQLAAEVGSIELPRFFAVTFLAMLFLTPLFSLAVSKWPRYTILPLVYLFFIICQLIFIPVFSHAEKVSVETLGLIFYVWVSVFNLFVVSVFWSFMADIWSDRQARRLFPIIALGGTAGAIAGPFITRSVVAEIGPPHLLFISIAFLTLAVVCIILLGKWARRFGSHRKEPKNEAALGGGMLDGLKQIFKSPFISKMCLIMLLNDAIGTIAYALVTDYSNVAFTHDAIAQTRFAANLDLSANLMQVIIQLTLTRWILKRFGASIAFLVGAGIVVFASLVMAGMQNPLELIFWGLPYVAVVLVITRALSYGMLQPARESLFTLVPRDLRYKGKNAVDTVVWRAGDVASIEMVNALRSSGVTVGGFGLIWAGFAAASGLIGWRLASRYEKSSNLSDESVKSR